MSEKRFSWKTEKLQHSDDEIIIVVDNANKEWKGHILNIVDKLNELYGEMKRFGEHNYKLEQYNLHYLKENTRLKEENEKLRRLFEEMKQSITINLTEEDEKELRKLLGLADDE